MAVEATTTWVYHQVPQYRAGSFEIHALTHDVAQLCVVGKDGAYFSILMGRADLKDLQARLTDSIREMDERKVLHGEV
jgi:hypothetical protein